MRFIKILLYLFIFILLFPSVISGKNVKVKTEKELGGVKIGMTKDKVIKVLGNSEDESQIVGPSSKLVYSFLNYNSSGILVVLKDNSVIFINIKSPCKGKTQKGLSIGDKLSKAKKLYGKGVKEVMGNVTKMYFPDYGISIKGVKGTVIIKEISLGKINIQ